MKAIKHCDIHINKHLVYPPRTSSASDSYMCIIGHNSSDWLSHDIITEL